MATVSGHVWLREGKRGAVWYAKWRDGNGQQYKPRIGPAWTERSSPPPGHLTKRLAVAELEAILTDARRGMTPAPTGTTFKEAAEEYLRFVADVRRIDEGTVRDYRGVIKGYLLDEFGDQLLEAITPDAIDAYKERLIAEGKLSSRTIVRHLTVLHGIFKRAKRKWGLKENPASADLVERPKVVYSGEFDTFDRDELERLAAAAESPQDATLYLTAPFTGLRTGELFALRWGHVDFVGGLLHVRRSWDYKAGVEKVPKGKRVRSVPLMPDVVDTLAGLKERGHFTEEDDLVFCSDVGDHVDYYSHLRRYKRVLKRAGLRDVRFHDLRHAFGTAAIQKLDAYAVQSYMGHQHYSTTQRYLHHKPRREDAARLQDAFRADVVPKLVPNSPESGVTEKDPESQDTYGTPQQANT
jgi:integrase